MDFDLFENEDDVILSSFCIASTQDPETPHNPISEFTCSGEDSINSQISSDSLAKNLFTSGEKDILINELQLFPHEFQFRTINTTLVMNYAFGEIRMNIQHLMGSLKDPIETDDELSYYQRRRQVTLFFHMILAKGSEIHLEKLQQHLESIRTLLNRITGKEILKLIYLANNADGNKTNSVAYHFLHGVLEWKLLDLFILQRYHLDKNQDESNSTVAMSDTLSQQLERVLSDLLAFSTFWFQKKKTTELLFSSPFPCTCIKESWLILQFFIEKYCETPFWKYLNSAMEELKCDLDSHGFSIKSFCEFTIWILKALMKLQGYRSNVTFKGPNHHRVVDNYELLESTTQLFFNSNPNEEESRIFLCNIMPIILEWWKPKPNISILLWEYFHKKLNSSFLVAATPSSLAVTCASGKAYLDKTKALLDRCVPDANLSSFTLFTMILGKIIEKLNQTDQINQTQKILGRIYSKFSLAKFLALNETGIHHLNELFLTLAVSTDFNDTGPKLREKLLSITLEKIPPNRQLMVTKGHVALLILSSERRCNISEYATKLLQQMTNIRNHSSVSKIVADGLLDIFTNAEDFDRGEHILIDSWIPNFLNSCTPSEQERTLQALHLIFDKIKENTFLMAGWNQHGHLQALLQALNTHVLPYIRQNFLTSFSPWIPKLAADFCTLTTGTEQGTFHRNYKLFIDSITTNRQAVPQFLLSILRSDKANLVDSSTVIQVWLRSLIQLSANNEDVINLTAITFDLEEFKTLTGITSREALQSKEPLCVFVSAVGKNYDTCVDLQTKRSISDQFNSYISAFEKWFPDKNEKSEVLFRFYSFIAIVIYNCANIVYTRSKITCFFHVALTRFILPTAVQMGKLPETKLAQAIHKVWPVLVQGIGKLNFRSDPYITKTLNDLITKWTPNMKISPNSKVVSRPFITCLKGENDDLSLFVFEKLTSFFLATPRRQADPNACLVITIFQEIVESVGSDEAKMITFMKASSLTILEHIMMVDEVIPSRRLLMELLKNVTNSQAFQKSNELRSLLQEHLKLLAKRHLAFYTFFYFELLMKIVIVCCPLVENITDYLLEEIRIVEGKRGSGEDNRIRSCMEKLKGAIAAVNSSNKK